MHGVELKNVGFWFIDSIVGNIITDRRQYWLIRNKTIFSGSCNAHILCGIVESYCEP